MLKFHFDILAPVYDRLISSQKPENLLKILNLKSEDKLLEVGGGTGRFAKYFTPYFNEIWLLDPSIQMLNQARKKYPSMKISEGYANDMPFQDNHFDAVLIHDSLHHWQNQIESLHEINRVIKQSGRLIICEIHPQHRLGYFITKMEKLFMMKSKFYTPIELKIMITKAGFEVKSMGWSKEPTYYIIGNKK